MPLTEKIIFGDTATIHKKDAINSSSDISDRSKLAPDKPVTHDLASASHVSAYKEIGVKTDKDIVSDFYTGLSKKPLPASIVNLKISKASLYNKFQIDFDVVNLPATVLNYFDPDQIDISVLFIGPGHKIKRVNAFWAIDYKRQPDSPDPTGFDKASYDVGGAANREFSDRHYLVLKYNSFSPDPTPWHVRFAPPKIGLWRYDFRIIIQGEHIIEIPGGHFNVTNSNNKGYIKASGRNFRFNNGDLFYPIGVHANWNGWANYNRIPYLFVKHVIGQIANYRGNHCRIFLTHGKFGIEQERLNDYASNNRQKRAFDLDEIVEYAQTKGVYLQFVLEERLQFVSVFQDPFYKWNESPYYTIDTDSKKFWSNETSIKIYKKKLRYIIARWGYSTAIFAFEFMNEISMAWNYFEWHGRKPKEMPTKEEDRPNPAYLLPGNSGAEITSRWINKMTDYCKGTLGDSHMYTASVDAPGSIAPDFVEPVGDKDFIRLSKFDFYTDHLYVNSDFQDYHINYLAMRARYLYPDLPYIMGEFGQPQYDKDSDKKKHCHVYNNSFNPDPVFSASDFHDALFASFLSGCAGTITYWSDFTNTKWGGQLRYFRPLLHFMHYRVPTSYFFRFEDD